MIDGNTDKTPIAVVCSKNSIRIVELSNKRVTVIENRTPFCSEMVNEACRRLGEYSRQQHYLALLIKPSAAGYAHYLLIHLLIHSCSGFEFGSEPILESEECD